MAGTVIGNSAGLCFELRWESTAASGTAAEATRGELSASLAGHPVWTSKGPAFSWTWIELLEYLAENWRWIEWEEIDPLGLGSPPERVRSEAEQRWEQAPSSRRDEEEEILWAFEQRHNLAAGIHGAWFRDLWLLRSGNEFRVAVTNQEVWRTSKETLTTLSELGDQIANRLSINDDERAKQARLAWQRRREVSDFQFVTTVTSLAPTHISEITRGKPLDVFWGLDDERESNEILAAARMAAPLLAPADLRPILERIRRLKRKPTPVLDRAVAAMPPLSAGKPFDQGYQLAGWLRAQISNPVDRVEPEDVLRSWRIDIKDLELQTNAVDAICCWGPRHGPAILINGNGRHARQNHGRRSTLAHEICHLLVDRNNALPLAEVFGGRVPKSIEARARAFAAEFLLPREIAISALRDSANPPAAVKRLTNRFGVSPEIVAWQVRNSEDEIPAEHAAYLRGLVSEPERF